MLGFVFGTICLAGLIKVGACHHHRGACGHRGHGRYGRGYDHGDGHRRGLGERAMLRWVFERLDTTHGQEKVILEAVEELRAPFEAARDAFAKVPDGLAGAIRGEAFDHGRVAELWVAQDKALEPLRLALSASLARVHEVLDERQRKTLSEILERSGRGPLFG